VGGDPGHRPADHVPHLDRTRSACFARQRRCGDQLRLALAGADRRAGGQSLRLGGAGAFKGLRFATIEAGIGWIPWLLDAMDEAYKKHHFWVRPKLPSLPSDYYRAHGFASFQEDQAGLDLADSHNLSGNFLWANDYPHHEGTWPHSAEAVERTMGNLSETTRANILGLNAARFLNLEVPARYRN
jgi:hypothetical protein